MYPRNRTVQCKRTHRHRLFRKLGSSCAMATIIVRTQSLTNGHGVDALPQNCPVGANSFQLALKSRRHSHPLPLSHLPSEYGSQRQNCSSILTYLPAIDLFSVQRTCHNLKISHIVAGTTYLQYILCIKINGVDDFPPPNFPYFECLELLRQHERSWNG
jgi:hypothetical protein